MKNSVRLQPRATAVARASANAGLLALVLMQSPVVHAEVLETSLLVRFNFDAPPVGNVIADTSSAATHAGTNLGAAWVARNAERSGVMGFDGLALNRIELGAAPDLNSKTGTIAFWMRSLQVTPTPRPYAIVLDRRTTAGDLVYQEPKGHLSNQAQQANGGAANSQTTVANVTDGKWHHIAYVYDQDASGFVSFYVDGIPDITATNSGAWSWDPGKPLAIGASHHAWWSGFTGFLDDFRIYNRVLTPSEVADVAGLGTSPRIVIKTGGQPLNVRVCEPNIAAFSLKAVVVNADLAALHYQWQADGIDIPGATNASYSFPAALADNGKSFRAQLSCPGAASVTSAEATLIVAPQMKRGEVELANVPKLKAHYQAEFNFDTNQDAALWTAQRPGLQAAFGSTDELYMRCEVPALKQESRQWEASGWKGERLNAQLLLWSVDSQDQIRVQAGDLRDNHGHVIPNSRIRLSLVRYVVSNLPYQAKGFDCGDPTEAAAYLMPDRLEDFDRFDLPGRTVRPVWLAVDIPSNAHAGDYTGSVRVQSFKDQTTLPITIHVQPQALPAPKDWKFRLDLWQNPWVVASYFQVQPWSEEHKMLLRKHLKMYADAGGKYITTYAVHSPWSDNSYALEGTMIEWTKTTAGSWKFDYSIFDQYVELAMEAGVREAITIYTPIPWGNRFRYLDEESGNLVYAEWSPKSAEFKAVWNVFLDDLKAHLKHKGWLKKTYLGINENPLELTLAAIKVIKEHSKDWRITYAGNWHAELSPLLDDYSVIITQEPSLRELQERARSGFTTTYYVCCNPPQPNTFVFSAPVEARYLGWYAVACGYNGFLRWAYDAWPADPMRDARHTLWPAGDCFLVYPGGNSSIRFEKLREGIVDYEKVQVLRELARRSSSEKTKDLMQRLENHLRQFAAERDYAKRDYDVLRMTETVEQGKKLIEALSLEAGR